MKDLLNVSNLPVEGTYKDDFCKKNPELCSTKAYTVMFKDIEGLKIEQEDLISRVCWFITYSNYESFIHSGVNFERKREMLKKHFNIVADILKLKSFNQAEDMYRSLSLPRELRFLRAVQKQIDKATVMMEQSDVKSHTDLKHVSQVMKDFSALETAHREAMAKYNDAKQTGVIKTKQGKILSALDSGALANIA